MASVVSISRVERGVWNVSLRNIAVIARALDMSVGELMGRIE